MGVHKRKFKPGLGFGVDRAEGPMEVAVRDASDLGVHLQYCAEYSFFESLKKGNKALSACKNLAISRSLDNLSGLFEQAYARAMAGKPHGHLCETREFSITTPHTLILGSSGEEVIAQIRY